MAEIQLGTRAVSDGPQMGKSGPEEKTPEICFQMMEMDSAINELEALCKLLSNKLDPVCYYGPQDGDNDNEEPARHSPHADWIYAQRARIRLINRQLSILFDAIEL